MAVRGRLDVGGRVGHRVEPGRRSGPGLADRLIRAGARAPTWASWSVLAVLVPTVWVVAVAAGGTATALPHLFYVPIVGAALTLGLPGAVLTALACGVLAGPLMPGDAPSWQNETFRAVMYLAVGVVTAAAVGAHRRMAEEQVASDLRSAIQGRPGGVGGVDQVLVRRVSTVVREQSFHIVFQPIYSLRDGRLLAVEALTRFHGEPRRAPDEWFAAAARAGCGMELELAAIAAAITSARALPVDVMLSLNASPATVASPRLHDLLAVQWARPATVELTEHTSIGDYPDLAAHLAPLRAAGVLVAVDDAGAGYASLQHIVQLAPDTIKIDKSLTQVMALSPVRRALGGALVDFGHRTGATIVVEGIETRGDLTIWAQLGADAAQGYVFGQPGPLPLANRSREVTVALGLRTDRTDVPTQRT